LRLTALGATAICARTGQEFPQVGRRMAGALRAARDGRLANTSRSASAPADKSWPRITSAKGAC
jgi:hypothetical protein